MFTRRNGSPSYIVAIEGADRVGKATQAKLAVEALNDKLIPATLHEIPHDDAITYPEIYRMLRDGAVRTHPIVFQTLHGINRRFFQSKTLPSLIEDFEIILLDRWTLSTRVYGEADGVSREQTAEILRDIVEPDLTLVLDGPAWPKEGLDVLEADDAYQEKVRSLYRVWCAEHPERIVKIDAGRDRNTIHYDILSEIFTRLGR
jgi:thymidylate kinase